jgi:hypothetical protein
LKKPGLVAFIFLSGALLLSADLGARGLPAGAAPSPQTGAIHLPRVQGGAPYWARNDSYETTCAEDDNINIPLFARQISRFRLTATHPTYEIGEDDCRADFSGCLIDEYGKSHTIRVWQKGNFNSQKYRQTN